MKHLSKLLSVLIALVALSSLAVAASAAPSGSPVRLGFQDGDDWEPAIAADHSDHVYVIWPHYGDLLGCTACSTSIALIQVSADRGQTWSAPRMVVPTDTAAHQVDVQVLVDPADGKTLYAAWLQGQVSDVVVTKSTDFGQTWSQPVVADNTSDDLDKSVLAARGKDVYVAYTDNGLLWVAASHDGGQHFASHLVRPDRKIGWAITGGGAVDAQGRVYFAWANYTNAATGNGPVDLYVSRSTDQGNTWTSNRLDTSAAPPDCSKFSCGWAFLGAQITMAIDPHGELYALWNGGAKPKGPERIYFARSTNGGVSWSARQDVSLAPSGVGHAFPAITSGGTDNVRIAWMDARSAGKWNVYYRSSSNAGATWSGEKQLSGYVPGYSYLDASGFTFPYGDYFEMDVDDQGTTQAIWGEGPSWNGPGNIWHAHTASQK